MWQIFQLLLTLFVIGAVADNCKVPRTSTCYRLNPFYVDKPEQLSQCSSKAHFRRQVTTNFNRVFIELLLRKIGKNCNMSEYVKILKEMRGYIFAIIDAYYSCTKADCTDDVSKATDSYIAFRKRFGVFTRSTVINYSPACAVVVFQVRPITFSSAENIISSMFQCAKLKLQQSTIAKVPYHFAPKIVPKEDVSDCNCVEISPRPIPKDEDECFSQEFIDKMRNFVNESWKHIYSLYDNSSSECDYSEIKQYYKRLESNVHNVLDLLEDPNARVADVTAAFHGNHETVLQYSTAVRNYILNNHKICYYLPRRVRTYPQSISSWNYAVLLKCFGYRE